jgi:hypothetical protein
LRLRFSPYPSTAAMLAATSTRSRRRLNARRERGSEALC